MLGGSGLGTHITHIVALVVATINLLTKSP